MEAEDGHASTKSDPQRSGDLTSSVVMLRTRDPPQRSPLPKGAETGPTGGLLVVIGVPQRSPLPKGAETSELSVNLHS